MSYHGKQPVPPSRHRSHSAVRSSGNSYNNRPRSLGLYNTNSTYTSPYSSNINPYSSPYNTTYSSNYKSPYYSNGYRNSPTTTTTSGYASLTIPPKSLANINLITTPNYTRSYDNDRSSYGHRSRRDAMTRRGSYNSGGNNSSIRDRSLSRSRTSLSSSNGMGSKSISLTSLNSEGYCSGNERSRRSVSNATDTTSENGEIIDYKKLYEQAIAENEQLREKLRKTDAELRDTKHTLEKINSVTSKNSLSELEKRERRAMERKLSEMEEELKQLQKLKAENERLKADNRSLTRVITKLTNSPKK